MFKMLCVGVENRMGVGRTSILYVYLCLSPREWVISAMMAGLPLSAPKDPWDCVLEKKREVPIYPVYQDPKREEGEMGQVVREWFLGLTGNQFSLEIGSPSGTSMLLLPLEMGAHWSRGAWFVP